MYDILFTVFVDALWYTPVSFVLVTAITIAIIAAIAIVAIVAIVAIIRGYRRCVTCHSFAHALRFLYTLVSAAVKAALKRVHPGRDVFPRWSLSTSSSLYPSTVVHRTTERGGFEDWNLSYLVESTRKQTLVEPANHAVASRSTAFPAASTKRSLNEHKPLEGLDGHIGITFDKS